MDRTDLYGECNLEGAPVDVWTAECCMKCVNPRCTRSAFGTSKFEIRTSTWYERLFSETPKMDPKDERYEGIAAKHFTPVNPEIVVNSDWSDPKESQPSPKDPPLPQKLLEPEPEPEPAKTEPEPVKPEPKPVEPRPVEPKEKGRLSGDLAGTNTPLKQGQMIKPGQSQPTSDTWDAPVSPVDPSNVRVIKPGEKIKLG